MDDGKSTSPNPGKITREKTEFDGWRSVTAALYMALLGYAVVVGIPVISTTWVEQLGFSPAEVNRVAGADMGGMSFGALFASLFINRVNRRLVILAGIIMAVVANGLCMIYLSYEATLWLRGLAGIGSGIYTSMAIATLGGTAKPARAFNLMLFAFAFTQFAEVKFLPFLPVNGIYGLFIGLYLFSLLFLHWIPPKASVNTKKNKTAESPAPDADGPFNISIIIPWLCLGAVFFTYCNIGTYWTNIEIASVGAGLDAQMVADAISWASLMSLCGCLVATLLSDRFGLSRPLLVALFFVAVSANLMAGNITETGFLVSVYGFNFLWIFVDVYQMGTMSNFDRTGKYVTLIPGAQGVGQIVGPNIAAILLSYEFGFSAVFYMCAIASLIGMGIYAIVYLRLKKTIPVLADAA